MVNSQSERAGGVATRKLSMPPSSPRAEPDFEHAIHELLMRLADDCLVVITSLSVRVPLGEFITLKDGDLE